MSIVPNDVCAYLGLIRDLIPYKCLHPSLYEQRREHWAWLLLFLAPSSPVYPWARFFHRRVVQSVERGDTTQVLESFQLHTCFPELYNNDSLDDTEKVLLHDWVIHEYQQILHLLSHSSSTTAPHNLTHTRRERRWIARPYNLSLGLSQTITFPINNETRCGMSGEGCASLPREDLDVPLYFCTRGRGVSPWVWCCSVREILESLLRDEPVNPRTGERLEVEVERQLRERYRLELKLLGWKSSGDG